MKVENKLLVMCAELQAVYYQVNAIVLTNTKKGLLSGSLRIFSGRKTRQGKRPMNRLINSIMELASPNSPPESDRLMR
jgi:CRISPR/Cas system-associated endonuclease Cas1